MYFEYIVVYASRVSYRPVNCYSLFVQEIRHLINATESLQLWEGFGDGERGYPLTAAEVFPISHVPFWQQALPGNITLLDRLF